MPLVMVGIFELKPLIETNCFRSVKYVSNHLFDFRLFCNDQYVVINSTKGLLKITNISQANYLHQELSLLTQLD